MKRTVLRKVSKKRQRENSLRKKVCVDILVNRSFGICEIRRPLICNVSAQDFHEILARSQGGSITDPDNAMATCFHCHNMLHRHPNEARRRGLLKDNLKSS